MKVLVVAGARPNFMKVAPILKELELRGIENLLVHTGQHYDPLLSDVFFSDLAMKQPDYSLDVGSGSHAYQTARVMEAFESLVEEVSPDVVIVVGDVNSTLGCALVGAKAPCTVAHVEAGLRSRDWAMPEEVNRVAVDHVSDYLFAPSPDAVDNLKNEGLGDKSYLVGNVMVDTLLSSLPLVEKSTIMEKLGLVGDSYALVTLHRPSNVDDPDTLGTLLEALENIAQACKVVFPIHPRTLSKLENKTISPNIITTEPVGYLDCIALEKHAKVVLTDSGGIQEETTVLGTPCLTLRESTERPITVSEGTNQVVGTDVNIIVEKSLEIIKNGYLKRSPALWDGKASERIVNILVSKWDTRY